MGETPARTRPGRPRRVPGTGGVHPRQQILDAAAALFVEHGFSATSTRQIAEQVGIRQASLYYHYAGKDDILVDLLSSSVRPTLDRARHLRGRATATVALYATVLVDVQTLSDSPHNIGTLYLLPEVAHSRFDAFRADRVELQQVYAQLAAAAATTRTLASMPPELLGELMIQMVEVIIQIRRRREPTGADATAIADACLKVCGVSEEALPGTRLAARRELAG